MIGVLRGEQHVEIHKKRASHVTTDRLRSYSYNHQKLEGVGRTLPLSLQGSTALLTPSFQSRSLQN